MNRILTKRLKCVVEIGLPSKMLSFLYKWLLKDISMISYKIQFAFAFI